LSKHQNHAILVDKNKNHSRKKNLISECRILSDFLNATSSARFQPLNALQMSHVRLASLYGAVKGIKIFYFKKSFLRSKRDIPLKLD
jgi:hypothetical protein